MALFLYCTIFHLALGRCEQSHLHVNVFTVFLCMAYFLWFYVDFYWYKQTQHATHNVQYVTYMSATGKKKSPAWNLKRKSMLSLGGICNRCTHWKILFWPSLKRQNVAFILKVLSVGKKRNWHYNQKWLISDIVHYVAANNNIVKPRI